MAIEPPNSVSREKDAKPQRKTPKRINLLGVVLVEAASTFFLFMAFQEIPKHPLKASKYNGSSIYLFNSVSPHLKL